MSEWLLKRGNTSTQDIPIKDADGNLVTNLADADSIVFEVKEKPKDTSPKIRKTVGSGITVNTPETGYLRLKIDPSDTENLEMKEYYMGLEITWGSDVYEVDLQIEGNITEKFRIEQDVVQ
jgi:hypothetical protein